jgi:MFS family permease
MSVTQKLATPGVAGLSAPAYRWVILFVAWLSFLLSFVDRLAWANVAISVGGSLGLPIAALGIFVTAFYVGYVICNALGGIASDRFGRPVTLAVSLLLLGISTFLFSFTTFVLFAVMLMVFGSLTDRVAFEIAAPLVGLGAFLYSPLLAAMVAEASSVVLAGSAAGVLAGFWQLGSVVVPVVVGIVFQSTGSFMAAFATLAIGPVLAAIALLFVKEGPSMVPLS